MLRPLQRHVKGLTPFSVVIWLGCRLLTQPSVASVFVCDGPISEADLGTVREPPIYGVPMSCVIEPTFVKSTNPAPL